MFVMLACLTASVWASPAAWGADDNSPAAQLAGQYVDNLTRQWTLEAQTEFCREEADRLEKALQAAPAEGNPWGELSAVDETLRQPLESLLRQNQAPVLESLGQAADDIGSGERPLADQWCAVRTALNHERMALAAARAGGGSVAAWLCGPGNMAVCAAALLAVFGLLYVACHDRRQRTRRKRHGREGYGLTASWLAVLATVAVLVLLALGWARSSLGHGAIPGVSLFGMAPRPSPEEAIRGESQSVLQELPQWEKRKQEVEARLAGVAAAWRERMLQGPSGLTDEALTSWDELRGQARRIDVARRVHSRMAAQLRADLETLSAARRDLAAALEATAGQQRTLYWVRGLSAVLLLGGVAAASVVLLRRMRERRDEIRGKCPLCLHEDTLKYDRAAKLVRCTHVFSEKPLLTCPFTSELEHLDMVKCCFPTLGTAGSGKTHWLAKTYQQLTEGEYPKQVEFFTIRSPIAETFRVIVASVLQSRKGTEATEPGRIPHPLIFDFADRDRWGRSNILVNVFDFAGAVVAQQTLRNPERARALEGDGFLYFLDPLAPRDTQSPALDGFVSELRMIHGAKEGKPILTPIALCVSKIDLMVNMPYAGRDGAVARQFYERLGAIGWGLSLTAIEARSRCVEALCDTIWPGWNIQQKLSGIPHLYFPLTPVGLDKPGETDLSKPVSAPRGLLAPLLWLLHMNGYRVFK